MKETKNMKWTSYNQQRAERNLDADIQRTKKHIFYCNLIIAACSGASVVLIGVLFHLAAN
ncbi:MAG: hypothetical protein H8E05_00650 [Bacteroidetes bacterium]|nr:hypothetical protein [Bacteroidota bacterium]